MAQERGVRGLEGTASALVVGLGISGRAAAERLLRAGIKVTVNDMAAQGPPRQAAEELRGEPHIRFLIAGEGPLADATAARVREVGLCDRVAMLGFQDDTAPLLAAADCLVAPSTREGLPIAFLEAMAAGCPVIATDVGGVSELVTHDQTGVLVPPDDFDALVAAVRRVAEDEGVRRRLSANARERIAGHFTAETNAAAVEDVLRRAIASRSTPAARSAC